MIEGRIEVEIPSKYIQVFPSGDCNVTEGSLLLNFTKEQNPEVVSVLYAPGYWAKVVVYREQEDG